MESKSKLQIPSLYSTLKTLEARIENMSHLLASLATPPQYQKVGEGDDGLVVLDRFSGNAIKIYIIDQEYSEAKKAIRQEQAYRELKALRAIGQHPNIVGLKDNELMDIKDLTVGSRRITLGIGIQLEYAPHLANLRHAACVWGFVPKESTGAPKAGMNFEHRNQILKHVLLQAFELLSVLEAKKLRHRDLDCSNVKLQLPTMTLKAMDFARTDISNTEEGKGIRNPDDIVQEAETQIKSGSTDPKWKDLKEAYLNPLNANAQNDFLPPGIEYTDKMAMKYTLKRELNLYMHGCFRWVDSSVAKAVVDENLTMMGLFNSLWMKEDNDIRMLLRTDKLDSPMQFIRNNTDLCRQLVEYNKFITYGLSSDRDAIRFYASLVGTPNDIRCQRTVLHSSDYGLQSQLVNPLAL